MAADSAAEGMMNMLHLLYVWSASRVEDKPQRSAVSPDAVRRQTNGVLVTSDHREAGWPLLTWKKAGCLEEGLKYCRI